MPALHIAIIGAGPAGTMLARLLHLEGIRFTIFEGEKAADFRSQGGTLDLHTETGLAAIKRAGLHSEFLKHARELLVNSLPEGCIQWGKRLRSVDSALKLHFDDGIEKGFDLVVGADGAWSRVRPFVSSVVPFYSGIGGYQSSILDAKETQPEIYTLVNRGSLFALSDCKSIVGQQMGDGSIMTSTWSVMDEKPMKKIPSTEAADQKQTITNTYSDWSPLLLEFVLHGEDDTIVFRPLYMLPIGHNWKHRPGVTLVGDVAHLMTPFAGEGVNVAFADATKLADAITKTQRSHAKILEGDEKHDFTKDLGDNVKDFEIEMFHRATKVQQLTYDLMSAVFYTPGPPRKFIRSFVLRAISDEIPKLLFPIVAALIYAYFIFLQVFY